MTEEIGKTKICKACGEVIPQAADPCPVCECVLARQPCKVCGKPIPKKAKFCTDCKSYQWLPFGLGISTAVLAALTGLVGVTIPALQQVNAFFERNSHTSVVLRRAGDNGALEITLWNTGHRPSQFDKAFLDFGDAPIERADLQTVGIASALIDPNSEKPMTLYLAKHPLKPNPGSTPQQVIEEVRRRGVTLFCVVNESYRDHIPRYVSLNSDEIDKWVEQNLLH